MQGDKAMSKSSYVVTVLSRGTPGVVARIRVRRGEESHSFSVYWTELSRHSWYVNAIRERGQGLPNAAAFYAAARRWAIANPPKG